MRTVIPKKARLIPRDARRVFQGKIFDVYHWPQRMFDGSVRTFEMLKRADSVLVLAIKDGRLVVLKQQQPNTAEFYGLPCGRHDDEAETELEAAQRELLEETGMTFQNWRLIWAAQSFGKIEWFSYWFLATDFIGQVDQKLDAGEKISVHEMTLDEVKNLIADTDVNSRNDFPREIFDNITTIDDLVNCPEYLGEERQFDFRAQTL
ncbi:NUDIX hydrolase [Candidatus Saccharibacteria bacterium]|nr:NUDIX hydrolase [Candidatus Saccharibacteria bacterium]